MDKLLLAIMTNSGLNISVRVFEHLLSVLLDLYLGVELLGHLVLLCLTY